MRHWGIAVGEKKGKGGTKAAGVPAAPQGPWPWRGTGFSHLSRFYLLPQVAIFENIGLGRKRLVFM